VTSEAEYVETDGVESSEYVDVRHLMAEIRADVEGKRRAEAYQDDFIQELDASFRDVQGDSMDSALHLLRASTAFSSAVSTASQKAGVGPVASAFKRAVRGSTRWYVSAVLQQVELFARRTANALTLLSDRLERLEDDVDHRLDEMKAAVDRLERALETRTENDADRFRDRISLLERSVRVLRERATTQPSAEPSTGETARSLASDLAVDYLDFENLFRGSEEAIRDKQQSYVALFADCPGPVVDVGCGRGEFLELLRAKGIAAYGIDRHPDMVAMCREKGLNVREAEALHHLAELPKGSIGGVFCAQMVEHLEMRDVPRLFELAADALAPGGRLVVETINPGSLIALAGPFYTDLGHVRPLHPLTLRYLAEKSGFHDVSVEYHSWPPDVSRPSRIAETGVEGVDEAVEKINENFHRVDSVLFGPQDYAVIARR
jgi:SAM-dependent methyltransferase